MTLDADRMVNLTVALVTGFPVIAVAYYAARSSPESVRANAPGHIQIAEPWATGPRGWALKAISPRRTNLERRTVDMGNEFYLGADRGMLLWFMLGLLLSVSSLVLWAGGPTQVGWARILTGLAVGVFVSMASTLVLFASQVAVLNMIGRAEFRSDSAEAFNALRFTVVVTNAAQVVGWVFALWLMVGLHL